jgi:hypothetical protein
LRIEELIAAKKDHEEVKINWTSLPVAALKKLMKDGYGRVDEGSYLPPSPTDPDVRN